MAVMGSLAIPLNPNLRKRGSFMWLIQGSWFQGNTGLDTEMVPIEGAVVVIKEFMLRGIFYGVLHPEPECCGGLFHPDKEQFLEPAQGWISDTSGDSFVFDVVVSAEKVSLTKVYQRRRDEVNDHRQRRWHEHQPRRHE